MYAFVPFLLACDVPDEASPEFSDAAVGSLAHFDDEDPAKLISAVQALEEQVLAAVDPGVDEYYLRVMTPARLEAGAITGIKHPDRDPTLGVPVALAWRSPYPPEAHDKITLLSDLVPVEPASPQKYDRTFDEGGDCYPDSCEFARTTNDVIRENLLFTMNQETKKDFRALDVEGRAFRLSRGWFEQAASNAEGTATVEQSYTIEVWLEDGDGALRVQVTWVETIFTNMEYDDELVAGTLSSGMDGQFDAHDRWISEQ